MKLELFYGSKDPGAAMLHATYLHSNAVSIIADVQSLNKERYPLS